MRVVGIDPGLSGAIVCLDGGNIHEIADMPVLYVRRGKSDKGEIDAAAVRDTLQRMEPDVVVIEQVGGITGQSASAAFNFGRGCGVVEGVAAAMGFPISFMAPGTWRIAVAAKKGKDANRAQASRQWPLEAKWFARVKDDGRADAALIALAWWLKNGGRGVTRRRETIGVADVFG